MDQNERFRSKKSCKTETMYLYTENMNEENFKTMHEFWSNLKLQQKWECNYPVLQKLDKTVCQVYIISLESGMEEKPNLEKFEEETTKWVEGRKDKRWTVSREVRKNYLFHFVHLHVLNS